LKNLVIAISLLLFLTSTVISSEAVGGKAPAWQVSEWINGPGVNVEDLKGKVVVVEFFQLWCPGCNRFSIPLMLKWNQTFSKEIEAGKLFMLSIHTVFEGHQFQRPEKLKSFVKEKGIHHLVGVDLHKKGERVPETMKRYNTRGTPEMAIIGKKGVIRFQQFGSFDIVKAEKLIKQLLKE